MSDVVGLFAGIAGLVSSVVLLMNPGAADFGGDIVLQLLLAASRAIIGPCLVLITAAWYSNTNGGSVVRLLLWASGYPVLGLTVYHVTVALNPSHRVYHGIHAGLATVCILLSVYIFARVDMPGVTMWLDGAHRKGRLRGREWWRQHRSSLPVCLCSHVTVTPSILRLIIRSWQNWLRSPRLGLPFWPASSVQPAPLLMAKCLHCSTNCLSLNKLRQTS